MKGNSDGGIVEQLPYLPQVIYNKLMKVLDDDGFIQPPVKLSVGSAGKADFEVCNGLLT